MKPCFPWDRGNTIVCNCCRAKANSMAKWWFLKPPKYSDCFGVGIISNFWGSMPADGLSKARVHGQIPMRISFSHRFPKSQNSPSMLEVLSVELLVSEGTSTYFDPPQQTWWVSFMHWTNMSNNIQEMFMPRAMPGAWVFVWKVTFLRKKKMDQPPPNPQAEKTQLQEMNLLMISDIQQALPWDKATYHKIWCRISCHQQ